MSYFCVLRAPIRLASNLVKRHLPLPLKARTARALPTRTFTIKIPSVSLLLLLPHVPSELLRGAVPAAAPLPESTGGRASV